MQLETRQLRREMVDHQLRRAGIHDPRVLRAMMRVPRHRFVPEEFRSAAYLGSPVPIGWHQTISQPYVVAYMCEAAQLTGTERVLEIGTGSGYGAAVLAELSGRVHTIERIPELASRARRTIAELGYQNIEVPVGDGTLGLPNHAPFDAILVTAAAELLPKPYRQQLAPGGRIIIPICESPYGQTMRRFTLRNDKLMSEDLGGFSFVPLISDDG